MSSVLTVQANVRGDSKSIIAAFKAAGAEVKGFKAETDNATAGVSKNTQAWGNAISSAAGLVGKTLLGAGAAVVGFGATFAGAAIVGGAKRIVAIQDATSAMTTVMGSATAAGDLMAEVLKVVSGTPFNLDQFAGAAKNLVAFGVPAQKVPGYLTAIGNAAAASGNGAEGVDSIVTSLGQAAAAGKLTTDTINSLSAQGVPALQILANKSGVTTEEMQKLLSDGAVPALEGIDMLTDGIMNGSDGAAGATVKFGGAMEALRQTFSGALGGMKASVSRFGAAALSPFLDMGTLVLQTTGTVIDSATAALKPLAAAAAASKPVQDVANWLRELNASGDKSSVVLGALAPIIAFFGSVWDQVGPPIKQIGETLSSTLLPALAVIGPALADASADLGISTWQIFVALLQLFADVLAVVLPPITQIITAIAGNEDAVKGIVIAYTAWSGAMAVLDVAKLGASLVKQTAQLLTNSGAWVKNTAAKIADKAQTVALAAMYAGSMVKSIAQSTAELAKNTAAWVANKVQKAASAAVGVAQAVAGTVAALAVSTAAVAKNSAIWLANKVAVGASAAASLLVKAPMLAGAAATGIATAAQWAFNSALLANPITWIIVGIVALIAAIVLLIANWDTVVSFLTDAWSGFMSWIQPALDAVGGWFSSVFGAIGDFLSGLWSGIVSFVTAYVTTLVTVILTVVGAVVGWWQGLWSTVAAVASAVWSGIVAFVTGYVQFLVSIVMTVVGAIVGWWSGVWSGISAVASAVWSGIVAFVSAYISTVQSIIVSVVSAVSSFWSNTWNGIKAVASAVWSGITSAVSSAVNAVLSVVSGVMSSVQNTWSAAWNGVKSMVAGAVSAVASTVRGLVSSVSGAIGQVGDFFSGIRSTVTGALAGAASWLTSAGSNLIQGLIGGVQAAAGRIKDAVLGPIKDSVSAVKSFLGIASPSRLFKKFGGWVGEGLAIGVTAEKGNVVSSTRGLATAMSAAWNPVPLKVPTYASAVPPSSSMSLARTDSSYQPVPYASANGYGYGGGPTEIKIESNVYPTPGMDEEKVARKANENLLWMLEGANV